MQHFIEHLLQLAPLNEEELKALKDRILDLTCEKGKQLLYPGDACKFLYFVEEGLLRSYTFDHNQEVTLNFLGKKELSTNLLILYHQQPSLEALVCETNCKLSAISYQDIKALQQMSSSFTELTILIMRNHLVQFQSELSQQRKSSASGRYTILRQKYPGIANIVSHKNIASYLGICPPTFSNLLKNA